MDPTTSGLPARFRLIRPLGRGGMGHVFEAEDLERGAHVALKWLSGESASVGRLLEEARLGRMLEHPNLVRVLDAESRDGNAWLSMELLHGATLSALLKERPDGWPVGLVIALALDALGGLGALHDAGVIHRDLKPSNLFVTREGRLKIIDLGIAVSDASDRTLTRTGQMVGSVRYASPEQAQGQGVDASSDQFSLALVLFELLTGEPVFAQQEDVAALTALLWHPLPHPLERRPQLPEAVAEAVALAMSRDKAKRPASARDFAALLAASTQGASWTSDDVAAWVRTVLPSEREASTGTRALPMIPGDAPVQGVPSERERAAEPRVSRRGLGPWLWLLTGAVALAGVAALVAGVNLRKVAPASTVSSNSSGAVTPARGSSTASNVMPVPSPPPVPNAAAKSPVGADLAEPKQAPPRSAAHAARPPRETAPGWVTVDVRPGWASVFVDGKAVGETPLYKLTLAPGRHVVRAVGQDGRSRQKQVVVTTGKLQSLIWSW